MRLIIRLLPAGLLLAVTAIAQTTAYEFRAALRPGMTIGGHTFIDDTLGNAVINDTGLIAFVVRWREARSYRSAVFTLHRMVASEGDATDSGNIAKISLTASLAINASGTVAYEAALAHTDAVAIFVERTFGLSLPPYGPQAAPSDFVLNNQEEIVMREPRLACAETRPRHLRNASSGCGPLSMLTANHRGQIVVPINTAQGPFLLVGTPRH
jgi:hypothetical protein